MSDDKKIQGTPNKGTVAPKPAFGDKRTNDSQEKHQGGKDQARKA